MRSDCYHQRDIFTVLNEVLGLVNTIHMIIGFLERIDIEVFLLPDPRTRFARMRCHGVPPYPIFSDNLELAKRARGVWGFPPGKKAQTK